MATGTAHRGKVTTTGGIADIHTGTDTNPFGTKGIFNSFLRLNEALANNDLLQVQRASQMLDDDINRLSFSRAELGARAQGLDVLQIRLEDENIELSKSLSQEIDVDIIEAISNLTARQASFEASLRSTASIFQLTLLDFI